jgi:hypothetical protein
LLIGHCSLVIWHSLAGGAAAPPLLSTFQYDLTDAQQTLAGQAKKAAISSQPIKAMSNNSVARSKG